MKKFTEEPGYKPWNLNNGRKEDILSTIDNLRGIITRQPPPNFEEVTQAVFDLLWQIEKADEGKKSK